VPDAIARGRAAQYFVTSIQRRGDSVVDRRAFIGCVAGGLLAMPFAARAQVAKSHRIGFLSNGNPTTPSSQVEAFRQSLRELGWIEGQNVTIDYRWAEGNSDRLPTLVAELVQAKVDVIVVGGNPAIRAAQNATRTIPIVFVVLTDPVTSGFVPSLARPGGNMTGLASEFEELITKDLQLLKEAVPDLSRVGLLYPSVVPAALLAAAETAARTLGLAARPLNVAGPAEFEDAFKMARSERAGAILVLPSPYFDAQHTRLIELAARYRLPACYEFRNYVRDGGLMSYGPSIDAMFARSASYVDRILKGANPGDLAIERPTKFELVINLKTAKALGLTISQSLLLRADEVIQ
jgi:putative tryptophan/tyrosine transport system substrate-binding protein